MNSQPHNSNLSGERRLTPARLSALAKARLVKLNPERRAEVENAVPSRRLGRLFRAHVKSCPHRKQGRSYIDCDCPIFLGEGMDAEGKKINAQSLHTRDWQQAEEHKAAIENGAPLESIGGFGKIFRKHEKICPYFGKGGISHRDCECTVWMHSYKPGTGKSGVGKRASLAYTRSLYTRDWQHACDLVNDGQKGAAIETIQLLGRLFRHHERTCPFFGQRGVSYLDCNCNVWTSAYKGKDVDGKRIRIPRHSLRTRSWESGRKQLIALADPEGLAQLKARESEQERSRELRLRPYIAFIELACGSNGSCRVKLDEIAAAVGSTMDAAGDCMREAAEFGHIEAVRHGRSKIYTVTLKGQNSLKGEGDAPAPAREETAPTRRGRPTEEVSLMLYAAWVEKGKPKRTAELLDQLARDFFPVDFSKAKDGSKPRKRLRDRVGATLRWHLQAELSRTANSAPA